MDLTGGNIICSSSTIKGGSVYGLLIDDSELSITGSTVKINTAKGKGTEAEISGSAYGIYLGQNTVSTIQNSDIILAQIYKKVKKFITVTVYIWQKIQN